MSQITHPPTSRGRVSADLMDLDKCPLLLLSLNMGVVSANIYLSIYSTHFHCEQEKIRKARKRTGSGSMTASSGGTTEKVKLSPELFWTVT